MNRHPAALTVSLGEGTLLMWVPAWHARTFDTDQAEPRSSEYDWPDKERKAPLTRPSWALPPNDTTRTRV